MTAPGRLGPFLVGAGLVLVALGLVAWAGGFSWFGHLPGDVRFERGGVRVFVPITSMIVVSAAVTLILNLVRRFLGP